MAKDKLLMNFDLTGMEAFAKSNGQELITDLIEQSSLFDAGNGLRVIAGVQSSDKFADISDDFTYVQATGGDPSSISASGGTSLADLTITVTELGIKEKYTKGTLLSKIAQMKLPAGSDPSNALPYTDILVGLKGKKLAMINELNYWQGNNTGSTYTQFSGIIKLAIDGGALSGSSTGVTVANALTHMATIVGDIQTNFETWITEGAYIYMNPKAFQNYRTAVFGLNSVIDKQTVDGGVVKDMMVPGTNFKVISTPGLTGIDNIIVTRENNFVVGTDLQSETDDLKFEYLNEGEYWRLTAYYKLGAQICRPTEVYITA